MELGSIMAGHGVTLPQYVAIARHAGSPCPRIPLILVSIPIWLPRNDPWPALRSTTYIVRCSPQTSSRHHQGTWAAELWAERQGFGPPIECQQWPAEDQGSGSDLGSRLLRTFIRPQKPSFSSRFPLSVFTGTRGDWATRHLAERSRQVPRQGTVQGGLCSTLHIVRVQKVRGV